MLKQCSLLLAALVVCLLCAVDSASAQYTYNVCNDSPNVLEVSLVYDCGGSVIETPVVRINPGTCVSTWPPIPPGCSHVGIIVNGISHGIPFSGPFPCCSLWLEADWTGATLS